MRLHPMSAAADTGSNVRSVTHHAIATVRYAHKIICLVSFAPFWSARAADEFGTGYVGFAFAASIPPAILEAVNYAIGQVRSNGDADVMYSAYFAAPGSCADTPASTTLQDGLGLPELSGVFYAGFILVGAAVVLLGLEHLLWRARASGPVGAAVNKGIGYITQESRVNAVKTEALFLQPVEVPPAPLCRK